MTAVEVCPICDIAGCHHIRDRKTDVELDALDEVYDTMMEVQRNPTGAWQAIQDQAAAITALRAQLAEADALIEAQAKDHASNNIRLAETSYRADRAEAALARMLTEARAERDAMNVTYEDLYADAYADAKSDAQDFEGDLWKAVRDLIYKLGFDWSGEASEGGVTADEVVLFIYDEIDSIRTRADRMLAEHEVRLLQTREKALREAAEILDDEGWLGMSKHRILALIEKD